MPVVEVEVGGRTFQVTCPAGQEPVVRKAAALLDAEAGPMAAQLGRMPDAQMLLVSALMLADKAAGIEDRLRDAEAEAEALRRALAEEQARSEPPVEVAVEVPVIPPELATMLDEIATEAEALARSVAMLAPERDGAPA